MIIVLQSEKTFLEGLKRSFLETTHKQPEEVFFTSNYREAIERVREEADKPGRTIVVSSAIFYEAFPGDTAVHLLTGSLMAWTVKGVNPTAWCFIYSMTTPTVKEHIDGFIPKDMRNVYAPAVEFLNLDFDKIESLEDLRRRLPWLL